MRNEVALRKPTFSEGYSVELADGQFWTLPKSRFRFVPVVVDGKVEIASRVLFGPNFDGSLRGIPTVDEEPDLVERLRAKFELTVRLLMANYELSNVEVADLV